VVNYIADLRAFLRWSEESNHGDRSPLILDIRDIQRYRSFLQETKQHAPATINRRLQALRKFYGFAVTEGWIQKNPAERISLLSENASPRSRHLSAADVSRLLEAVRRGRPRWVVRDWAIIQVFLGAGLKLSELTELHVSDVHIDVGQPALHVSGDLDHSSRVIPLETDVCDALRAYLSARKGAPGVEHLFVNRDGRPLSTRSVQRLLRHYAREAELDDLTTQALRYVYARSVFERSGDLKRVTELLGHRHVATTIRYLRPSSPQGMHDVIDNQMDS
jgi:integrase/recombinase XerD